MDEASLRVSDDDRDRAVASLREHLLAGRLTLEEFTERVDEALRAKVGSELAVVQRDLPATPPSGTMAQPSRNPTRVTGAILSRVVRRGRLRLGRRTLAVSALGDLDLDLRQATMDQPKASITVLTGMGNTDVYVPEGVDVDFGGLVILGHRRDWGRETDARDAPLIKIRAFGLGTVDIWRVPHEVRGSYQEVIKQVRELHRQLPS
jgi:hypothetical protein